MSSKPTPPPCTGSCTPVGTVGWPVPYRRGEAHASAQVCDLPRHQAQASRWVEAMTGHPGVFMSFEQARSTT